MPHINQLGDAIVLEQLNELIKSARRMSDRKETIYRDVILAVRQMSPLNVLVHCP
jgi:hypothetical protein